MAEGPQDFSKLPNLPADPSQTFETLSSARPMDTPTLAPGEPVSMLRLVDESSSAARNAAPATGGATPAGTAAYVLHRMIARGGFGEVWEATQVSIGRVVAVKRLRADVVHRGSATEVEFRQEALTAAQLEHPNIVPVHDLGADEEGRPVIAMKMVRGRTWSAQLDEDFAKLGVPDFLGLHLPVLMATIQAVAFAHSRGVVHRDLKPSQVMTGEFGEVMLMDWGLAISSGDSRTPTGFGGAIPTRDSASSPAGTPVYMAPEQTRPTAEGVGPWTDVYLLGGMLYHLLTGRAPHHAPSSVMAMVRAENGTVEPPSKAAGTREVPPELERICMRALSREPKARHASAMELLGELRDYLSGAGRRRQAEELAAQAKAQLARAGDQYLALGEALSLAAQARALWNECPPARDAEEEALGRYAEAALRRGDLGLARVQGQRLASESGRASLAARVDAAEAALRRQASQRRAAIAAALVLLAALAGGAVFSRARIAEQRDRAEVARATAEAAQREEAAARAKESEARADAELQRAAAIEARGSAEELVQFMLTDLRARLAPRDPKLELLDSVAQQALRHYDAQTTVSANVDATQLFAYVRGTNNLADVLFQQGRDAEAAALARKGAAAAEALAAHRPGDTRPLRVLSSLSGTLLQIELRQGRDREAMRIAQEDVTRLEAARRAGATDPAFLEDLLISQSWLATLSLDRRPIAETLAEWDRFDALLDETKALGINELRYLTSVGASAQNRAQILERNGDLAGAKAAFERGLATLEQAYAKHTPPERGAARAYASTGYRFGRFLLRAEDPQRASEVLVRAHDVLRELAERYPDDLEVQKEFSVTIEGLAQQFEATAQPERALEARERQVALLDRLLERDPANVTWIRERILAKLSRASALASLGRAADARTATEEANAELERVVASGSTDPRLRELSAAIANREGTMALRAGRAEDARRALGRVVASFEAIPEDARTNRNRVELANSYMNLASAEELRGDKKAELAAIDSARLLYERLAKDAPELDEGGQSLTRALFALAKGNLLLGRLELARERSDAALAILRGSMRTEVADPILQRRTGQHLVLRGRIGKALGEDGADGLLREATVLLEPLGKGLMPDPFVLEALAWAALELGDRDAAKAYVDRIPEKIRDKVLLERLAEEAK